MNVNPNKVDPTKWSREYNSTFLLNPELIGFHIQTAISKRFHI
jgi:hypothetical protein